MLHTTANVSLCKGHYTVIVMHYKRQNIFYINVKLHQDKEKQEHIFNNSWKCFIQRPLWYYSLIVLIISSSQCWQVVVREGEVGGVPEPQTSVTPLVWSSSQQNSSVHTALSQLPGQLCSTPREETELSRTSLSEIIEISSVLKYFPEFEIFSRELAGS